MDARQAARRGPEIAAGRVVAGLHQVDAVVGTQLRLVAGGVVGPATLALIPMPGEIGRTVKKIRLPRICRLSSVRLGLGMPL